MEADTFNYFFLPLVKMQFISLYFTSFRPKQVRKNKTRDKTVGS